MTPEEALRLIQQGESQTVEFKRTFAEANDAIESLCAFANADGGAVFFGVANDGSVVDPCVGENTLENFANRIRERIYPQIQPHIYYPLPVPDHVIAAVKVAKASKGKVYFLGRPLFRSGRTNQQMSWDQVRDKILEGEPDWSEERDRPVFEVALVGRSGTEEKFEPKFRVQKASGDNVANLEWRIRGPRFPMEWRQARGSALARTNFLGQFDLSQLPAEDDTIGVGEMGFEIRFHWRGRFRHELHRWPLTRQELPAPPRVHWNMGDEILPPLYFDEAQEGETTG